MNPKSYACNLCSLTHGFFTEKKKWKNFKKAHKSIEMHFLHADEFQKEYASKFGYKFDFPIVLEKTGYELEVFVSTKELNEIKNLEELIELIEFRLN
ncbi:GTPase [Mesonia aquimarina]|uniref:GTPase n=1 Tax=Mesonia aquimarina TaxID=1504967 RepID=UPI001F088B2D|nr:GTPase [Mesonia aquimarina]